jgi:hypothetical protein
MSAPSLPNIEQFSSNKYIDATKEFLDSNSLVAKLAFLIFVLFMYVAILRTVLIVYNLFYGTPNVQKFTDGMMNGNQMLTFNQDPSFAGAKTVGRSQNQKDGIEFTWSIWIFIDPTTPYTNSYQHIFHKGNANINIDKTSADVGLNFPNNAPGLYIMPNKNALSIIMNTYSSINEEIEIDDIPLNKWINVLIRCTNKKFDVYINGIIAKSMILSGVPKQNYGNVYAGMNGGFTGNYSNLWYYNYALGTREIQELVKKGANTTAASESNTASTSMTDYLSLRWYFN